MLLLLLLLHTLPFTARLHLLSAAAQLLTAHLCAHADGCYTQLQCVFPVLGAAAATALAAVDSCKT